MASETFGLFDVLGFRAAIRTESLKKVRDRMFRFFYILRAATLADRVAAKLEEPPSYQEVLNGEKACHFHQFSDSILLRAKGETEQHVETLVHAARKVLAIGAVQGTLLRGTLCHGELAVDEDIGLFIGKALVDAYEMERKQEWSGCVVHPDFVGRWPNLVQQMRDAGALVDYPVPMKSGEVGHQVCVNWASKVVGDLEDILIGPDGIPRPNIHWDAYRKQKNTVEFFEQYQGRG